MQLSTNEKIVLKAKKHWLMLLVPFLLTLVTGGIALPWLIFRVISYSCDEIIITDKNFHLKMVTLTSISSISTPLEKINNFSYKQDLIDTLFDIGTITIQSAAINGAVSYSWVQNPEVIKTLLNETTDKKTVKVELAGIDPRIQSTPQRNLCPHCGKYYEGNAAFCPLCGQPVQAIKSAQPTQLSPSTIEEPQQPAQTIRTCKRCGKTIPDGYDDCFFCN